MKPAASLLALALAGLTWLLWPSAPTASSEPTESTTVTARLAPSTPPPSLPALDSVDDLVNAVPPIEPAPTPLSEAKGGAHSYYDLEPAAREAYDTLMRSSRERQARADARAEGSQP